MPYPNASLAGSTGWIDCSRVSCISGVSNGAVGEGFDERCEIVGGRNFSAFPYW